MAALTSLLTSSPLVGILNGRFDQNQPINPDYGWSTRGSSSIINGQAVLSEGDRFNSNFSQTFVIPEGAKYLQFTLLDTKLEDSSELDSVKSHPTSAERADEAELKAQRLAERLRAMAINLDEV